MGCLSTVPVLVSASIDVTMELIVVDTTVNPPCLESFLPELARVTAPSRPPDKLYLFHRRFVI
jgi:hypothetical protein